MIQLIGLIIPLGGVFIYLIWNKEWKVFTRNARDLLLGFALFLVVAAPWYVIEIQCHGAAFIQKFLFILMSSVSPKEWITPTPGTIISSSCPLAYSLGRVFWFGRSYHCGEFPIKSLPERLLVYRFLLFFLHPLGD